MKLEFLGTGASNWLRRAPDGGLAPIYENGEHRGFTSTVIDDSLMFDGTSALNSEASRLHGIPALIYTHSHPDHYDPDFRDQLAPKAVYCHESWSKKCGAIGLSFGAEYEIAGHTVIPLPSNHSTADENEQTSVYLIIKGDERLLYSTDGAWITNRGYHIIKKYAPLTCCVFDGTVGDEYPDNYRIFEHNTLPMVRMMRASLAHSGLLVPGARVFVTHLARGLHPVQRVLEEREKQSDDPLIIAHDGMVAET